MRMSFDFDVNSLRESIEQRKQTYKSRSTLMVWAPHFHVNVSREPNGRFRRPREKKFERKDIARLDMRPTQRNTDDHTDSITQVLNLLREEVNY